MKKQGFTLVELSIVLVIIGLLIGGILVGQSLIESAKMQSFIRQIQQFDIAIASYETKYNGFPGDTAPMGCTNASNTCGDGILQDANGNNAPGSGWVQNFTGEIANFWVDLQRSGFKNPSGSTLTSTVIGGITSGGSAPNTPGMPIGETTEVLPYYDIVDGAYGLKFVNYYAIADWTPGVGNYIWGPLPIATVKSVDAMAIDSKIDDGVRNTGAVLGTGSTDWIQTGACGSSPSAYAINDICMVLIKMKSQVGL